MHELLWVEKCLLCLGTLVACIKDIGITNTCKKKKKQNMTIWALKQKETALVKKQMEENLAKGICRMKHSGKSAIAFTVTFLYQITNVHIPSSFQFTSKEGDGRMLLCITTDWLTSL